MEIVIILLGLMIIVVILLSLYEKNRIYTDADFRLKRIENSTDNTYYFQIPVSFFQYKKKEGLRKRYGQNSIIYCEEDNSYHRVLKWGANVQGIQRIIAEPYIVEEIIPNTNYTVYISNYGSSYIDLSETYYIDELYKEISNADLSIGEQEKSIALNTLKDIKERKVVRKNSLENLCAFLEKYDTVFSFSSNVLSIISAIMGFMK